MTLEHDFGNRHIQTIHSEYWYEECCWKLWTFYLPNNSTQNAHIAFFHYRCKSLIYINFMLWFHRFNKAYETIEYGDILDALTDLTGAICEYFTPDVNPPEQFFYTLYTSVVNRSLVVCWRNEKRLTWSGFNFEGVCNQKAQISCDMYSMLWINGVVLLEWNIDYVSFLSLYYMYLLRFSFTTIFPISFIERRASQWFRQYQISAHRYGCVEGFI